MKACGTGRIRVLCRVMKATRGGLRKPLANAEVKFVPEDFLGPGVASGHGHDRHDRDGPDLAAEARRRPDGAGMSLGLLSVEITKGRLDSAVEYNTETILGQEVAADVAGVSKHAGVRAGVLTHTAMILLLPYSPGGWNAQTVNSATGRKCYCYRYRRASSRPPKSFPMLSVSLLT